MCPYLDDKLNYLVDDNEFAVLYLFFSIFIVRLVGIKFFYKNTNLVESKIEKINPLKIIFI